MNQRGVYNKIVVFLFIFLLATIQSYGYEVRTHAKMTEEALKQSFSTKDFLSAIGYKTSDVLTKGTTTLKVREWSIEWAKEGSVKEDDTWAGDIGGENFRYVHHFYDPVNNRGLDFNLAIAGHGYYRITGNRAPDWALEDNGTFSKQFYSIQHAKGYYFAGLTASTKDEREANLAKTFKTLGQVLHILQDMAQPQHTRNDPHGGDILSTPYGPQLFGAKSQYELYVNVPKRINTFNYAAPYPASFDTYRKFYVSADAKGMSTFSNRNFVTEGTNFNCTLTNCQGATGGGYVSPVLNVATQYDVAANQLEDVPPSVSGNVTFFKNTFTDNYSGQAVTNDRMTTYSLFDRDLKSKGKAPAFTLNKANYKEMANLLLPRAVGYSAGLLNYFFRGGVSLVPAGDSMDQYVIINSSTEEVSGTFSLYYDVENGDRILITKWENITIGPMTQNGQETIPGMSALVTFPTPTTPAPKEKNTYFLVFQGKMGNEEGAVAGKVVRWWHDEWDNELKTNHPWLYTDVDFVWPIAGVFYNNLNAVAEGRLTKENVRLQGESYAIMNSTLTEQAYKTGGSKPYCIDESRYVCLDYDFGKEFPIPITKNTWIRVKVDEMSRNVDIPYQTCNSTNYKPGSWQGITLGFDNGRGFTFTVPGEVPMYENMTSYIEPGVEKAFNIFEAFKNAGVVFNEPINLTSIEIQQMLWFPCGPSTEEHRQRMVVDYIRLEER